MYAAKIVSANLASEPVVTSRVSINLKLLKALSRNGKVTLRYAHLRITRNLLGL